MIKSECCSICGASAEPAYGHHHNSGLSSIHMKNQACHQHSGMIRLHGVMREREKPHTCTDTRAPVYINAYINMERHTQQAHRCTLSGMHYCNPDRWIDIPPPRSPLVTTSFFCLRFSSRLSFWTRVQYSLAYAAHRDGCSDA